MPTEERYTVPEQSPTGSPHPVESIEVDVLIVGAGPIGCVYARKLIESGRKVFMIDAGAQLSRRPGEHLKNSFLYQRNTNLFASVIRGHIQTVSVPTDEQPVVTLDPGAYRVNRDRWRGFVRNGQNPDQDRYENLDGMASTYAVGGMTTHWTCATPRQHPEMERMDILSDSEWDELYTDAEAILKTSQHEFDQSMRHTVVKDLLSEEFSELPQPFHVQSLPLAVKRRESNNELVWWSAADTVLGDLADGPLDRAPLVLKEQHRCTRLIRSANGTKVICAEVEDLQNWKTIYVHAKTYVVAVNAVLTPQLLFNSGIELPALGRYLTEQPLAFCQIVLKQSIVDGLETDPRFEGRVAAHRRRNPKDPLPIPTNEPPPQVWIPVSKGRPWHCQIHRDAFNYGDHAPNIDTRVVVDLRWFGIIEQRKENYISFSKENRDSFGMPQLTFHFQLSKKDRAQQNRMMGDMLRAGFIPGSEPQFMPPGLPLHVHGTVRMGTSETDSVVDRNSRVWSVDNLYLGGNGLLGRANACNPTLTSLALALRACRKIVADRS
jgi:pyranose oxidase